MKVPEKGFFVPCVRVQSLEDHVAVVARHRAEEGRWPEESTWAAMQQVVVRRGFAFKAGPALARVDARMARRDEAWRAARAGPREMVGCSREVNVSSPSEVSRGMLAEIK